MIYVLYGLDSFSIKREIDKIKKKLKIDSLSFSIYNFEQDFIQNIIDDANTFSLFQEKKLIVAENALFLTGKNGNIDHVELLEEYIKNSNPETTLILTVNEEKLDERKKIVKLLKKECTVKECKIENEYQLVKQELEDYKMDDETIKIFIERVGNETSLLFSELEKLKLLKSEEKKIKKEDVFELTTKNISLDIFEFIDDILCRRKEKALETLYELLKRNTEPIAVIVMLANQIRIMYQSKELSKQGYLEKDIARMLNLHPFRVKKALEKGYRYSSDTLLNYLESLAKLDVQIKKGILNKDFALELFILEV